MMEQNLVNGRFRFTRLRLHSFCPALELTSEYLHCNRKVNHTEPGSGRERTTLQSVAKYVKVEDFSFPVQPRSPIQHLLWEPEEMHGVFITESARATRICVIRSKRRSGRGAEYQSETVLAGLPGRALLAPAGFRGSGRARPGRRRRRQQRLLPLLAPRARGEPAALRRRQKANVLSAVGLRVNEALRLSWTRLCPRARRFAASAAASRPVISLVPSRLGRKAPSVPAWPRESRQRSARQGPAAVPRRAGPVNVQSGAGKPCLSSGLCSGGSGSADPRPPQPARPCAGRSNATRPSILPRWDISPWKLC